MPMHWPAAEQRCDHRCYFKVANGAAADDFLGTQGDPWDTQSDMACALIGAIVALTLLSRWHDRSLARVTNRE